MPTAPPRGWARSLLLISISASAAITAGSVSLKNEETVLAAHLGSTGRLQELRKTTHSTLVRRQPDADPGADPPAGDTDPEDQPPHPQLSIPRMKWKDTPEAQKDLKKLLTCPGNFAKKQDVSKPKMCSNNAKMDSCDWMKVDGNVATSCGLDCFCEAADVRPHMSMSLCKSMCDDKDPCIFTYTSSKGCKIYSSCTDSMIPESNNTLLAMVNKSAPDDWVTCERFFDKYYSKSIALHNKLYNRFLMMKKQDDGTGILTRTYFEVSIEGTNQISSSMRFTVTNSSDSASLNSSPDDLAALEAPGGSTVDPGTEPGAPGAIGGPGVIALYSGALTDGQPYLTMGNGSNMFGPIPRTVTGSGDINENSLWTVCYLGPNEIALHNQAQNRYLAMSLSGVVATKEHKCCTPPKDWDNARFTVVVPPALTGQEDTANDKVQTPEMSTKERIIE